ncbi:MAG: c-type cytochrome [Thermodesulfovibrionales bacterium]
MKKLICMLASICSISLVVSLAAESHKDPKKLFEETCSECHSIDIPKEKRLSKAEWQDIVKRMKSNGLSISLEDEKIIVEYLSSTYGVK